jgi:hypothetical protein
VCVCVCVCVYKNHASRAMLRAENVFLYVESVVHLQWLYSFNFSSDLVRQK